MIRRIIPRERAEIARDPARLGLLVAVLGACFAPDLAPTSGAVASALTQAEDDPADPAVVALARDGRVTCSATKIAQRFVVTAAHCVTDPPDTVLFGSTPVGIRRVIQHPSFDPQSLEHDLGVIELSADTPEPPVRLAPSTSAPLAGTVRLVGFGRPSAEGAAGQRRRGTAAVGAVTERTFELLPGPSLPCNGDSGAAVLRASDEGELLAGVVSYGDEKCSERAFASRVDVERAFLDTAIAEPANATDSGCAVGRRANRTAPSLLFFLAAVALVRRGAASRRRPDR